MFSEIQVAQDPKLANIYLVALDINKHIISVFLLF